MDLKYFDWAKHQALMRPNKVAIKDYYSGEQLTYLELEKRAIKIAAYFKKKNIGNKAVSYTHLTLPTIPGV